MTCTRILSAAIRQQRHLEQLISDWLHNIANLFDILRHDVASIWDLIWNNTIGRAERGYTDLLNIFTVSSSDIISWFHDAINCLATWWRGYVFMACYYGISNAAPTSATGSRRSVCRSRTFIGWSITSGSIHRVPSWLELATTLFKVIAQGLAMSNSANVGA